MTATDDTAAVRVVELHVERRAGLRREWYRQQWFRCPECGRKIAFETAFVGFMHQTCGGCRAIWRDLHDDADNLIDTDNAPAVVQRRILEIGRLRQ
jgi:hypothetical protein